MNEPSEKIKKKPRKPKRRSDAISHDNPEELAACGDHEVKQ